MLEPAEGLGTLLYLRSWLVAGCLAVWLSSSHSCLLPCLHIGCLIDCSVFGLVVLVGHMSPEALLLPLRQAAHRHLPVRLDWMLVGFDRIGPDALEKSFPLQWIPFVLADQSLGWPLTCFWTWFQPLSSPLGRAVCVLP